MTIIECKETNGWRGIRMALNDAVNGDTVLIKPGKYTGRRTLIVNSGVRLCAEKGSHLTAVPLTFFSKQRWLAIIFTPINRWIASQQCHEITFFKQIEVQ